MTEWEIRSERRTRELVVTTIIRTDLLCPKCSAVMYQNGLKLLTATPGYIHECGACGHTIAISGERFPQMVERGLE